MTTKLIKLMGILAILLLISSPALAADYGSQSSERAAGGTNAAIKGTYTNPLAVRVPDDGMVESCADPSTIYNPTDSYWYMYCTTDPLNDEDKSGENFNFHLIPMLRSSDLVNWTYMGDAFATRPAWIDPTSGLWAPEIKYFNEQYYLYYTIPNVGDAASGEPGCGFDPAIGVATSSSPLGPWVDSGAPVVEPRRGGDGCNFLWTFDPEIVIGQTQNYIFFGSYYGGIAARRLTADGLHSEPGSQEQITIPNRYEGSEVVFHEGYWYLFASATNCCNGPLTGYSVFVGRSETILGPYVDREGVSLLAGRVGGTPILSMNGNRWVGPGHNSVFEDFDGQWWTVYHAVDRNDPYFEGAVGFTKRPVLLDALDWIDGWPTVRGGFWASDNPEHAPAAQPGTKTNYRLKTPKPDELGEPIPSLSDEFNGTLGSQWSWVREPSGGTSITTDTFNFDTQPADLFVDSNNASVLIEDTPKGDYVVETRLKLNLPPEGCCYNYVQAGLVLYGDDDNFIKLVHVSIWETRQTEFAKEVFPVPDGYPRYGNTVVGPPGEWTYLRIVKRNHAGEEHYTAYTSTDGINWVRGGTWTHELGSGASVGLVSMGGSGFTAEFDYVRVYRLN